MYKGTTKPLINMPWFIFNFCLEQQFLFWCSIKRSLTMLLFWISDPFFAAAQLLESMDRTTDPCQDFYQYACGNWNKKHIIPDDRPSFNTFEKLHDDLQIKLKSNDHKIYIQYTCSGSFAGVLQRTLKNYALWKITHFEFFF